MGLHYTTHLIIDDVDLDTSHQEDILDAGDQLVTLMERVERDENLPRIIRDMADRHAAALIRLCYDRILLVGEQHSIWFTQVGMPMVRFEVRRHEDIPGTPTPTLIDNLTGQPV